MLHVGTLRVETADRALGELLSRKINCQTVTSSWSKNQINLFSIKIFITVVLQVIEETLR